jgi:hypothetical protein
MKSPLLMGYYDAQLRAGGGWATNGDYGEIGSKFLWVRKMISVEPSELPAWNSRKFN